MSKHDSWVYIKEGSPYDAIAKLFPNGYPVRDPFAMATATDANGRVIPLWIFDWNGRKAKNLSWQNITRSFVESVKHL